MQSSSSTSSLLSSHQPHSPSKNWASAFGTLSSSYGFSGSVPSLPKKSSGSTKSSKSSRSASPSSQPSMSQSHKDYENTFGRLSSRYGFSGSYPSVSSKVPKSTTSPSQPASSTVKSGKDYEKSLGDLMVSNGFGSSYRPTRV